MDEPEERYMYYDSQIMDVEQWEPVGSILRHGERETYKAWVESPEFPTWQEAWDWAMGHLPDDPKPPRAHPAP